MSHNSAPACAACGEATGARRASPMLLARVIIALDRVIYRVSRRWLFIVNSIFFVHVMTLLLAPVLVANGQSDLAKPIYLFNGLFCHQRADRSFKLYGEKMACCQRCAAIYGSIMLVGLIYALLRGRLRRPSVPELAMLAMPVVVDGTAQLLGLWQSTAGSRVLTGSLLGFGLCWFLLPYLEAGFERMRLQIEALFARLVAEGRARPL